MIQSRLINQILQLRIPLAIIVGLLIGGIVFYHHRKRREKHHLDEKEEAIRARESQDEESRKPGI